MSTTQTPHLGLIKPTPGTGEYADVSVINGNMDKLDAAIGDIDVSTDGSLQSQIDGIQESVSSNTSALAKRIKCDGWEAAAWVNNTVHGGDFIVLYFEGQTGTFRVDLQATKVS